MQGCRQQAGASAPTSLLVASAAVAVLLLLVGVFHRDGHAACPTRPLGVVQVDRPAPARVHRAAVALGAHTLLGQEDGYGANPATTEPITTQASGSALLAFSAGYASNTNCPTDSKSNLWSQLGSPVVYNGYDGQFDVKAYVSMAAHGGSDHTVSIVKNTVQNGELTLPFIEIRNAGVLQAVARNYPTAGTPLTSGSVTTTGPATLIAVWWGDAVGLQHSAVPDNGFTIIENFVSLPPNSAVQCVVAWRDVAAAGTYDVTWTEAPDQGAPLWLFAFQSGSETIFSSGFE